MLHRRTSRYESKEWCMNTYNSNGSHMPLDTRSHWSWENPLIVFPFLIILFTLVALVAIVI